MFNRQDTKVQIQQQQEDGSWKSLQEFSTRVPSKAYCVLTSEAVEAARRGEYGILRAMGYEEGNEEEFQQFQKNSPTCSIAFAIAGFDPSRGVLKGVVTTFTSDYQMVDTKTWDNTDALINVLRQS